MLVELLRYTNLDSPMTRGILLLERLRFCDTLELPWKNNEKNISCIPEGIYKFEPHLWKGKYPTKEFIEVPNRNYVLFHSGNFLADIKGCVLVGNISKAGLSAGSKQIFEKLIKLLPEKGEITIKWI